MKIAILLGPTAPDDPTPQIGPVMADIIAHLRDQNVQVDLWVPERAALDLFAVQPEHDLYVLKSKTALALSVAGVLEATGACLLNSARASALARDKIAVTALLAAAGVPVPPSWATDQVARLRPLLSQEPLWVKPQWGQKGHGVRQLCPDAGTYLTPNKGDRLSQPVLAQRHVPSAGRDLKVYVVGDQVSAVEKPWPVRTPKDNVGCPVDLPPDVREAALRCGEVVGLEVYGVDFVGISDRFFAVDVNAFPGYRGVPNAALHLADYIHARAAHPSNAGNQGRDSAWTGTEGRS